MIGGPVCYDYTMEIRPQTISRTSSQSKAASAAPRKGEGLEFPSDSVELARNNRPVILLHGTLVEKEGISAYRDFALRQGHPVDYRTYQSITQGREIEKSAELASVTINRARAEIAEKNVAALSGASDQELSQFFALDGDLYKGAHDADSETIKGLLPSLVGDVAGLLAKPKEIDTLFSGKLKGLQEDLETKLQAAGVAEEKGNKIAAELIDSIAPKAIVVGHSAGGYAGYALTVNPETTPDNDPFTFDGGNGVGEMIVISSPIKTGLPAPAPPGVLDLGFYQMDSKLLRPAEELPASQLALSNPFFNIGYQSLKALTKQAWHMSNYVALSMSSPLIYLARPGNAQVVEGSEFFNNYVKDKKVPDGVSVIAVTSPLDQLSQESRSTVDDSQPNAHNFSARLEVTDEQVQRERPTWTHVIMTEQPDAFQKQFAERLTAQPNELAKVLSPSNDDGLRYEALQLVEQQLQADPKLLKGQLKKTLQAVAAERAPFKDSPSYLAFQLLQGGSAPDKR